MISIVSVCILDQIVDIMNGNKPDSINIVMGKNNNVRLIPCICIHVFYKTCIHVCPSDGTLWCPVSRITTPLTRKTPFLWISMKSRLVRAARETSKFHNCLLLANNRRRYMAEILPIRRKIISN